jgi:hypothetical protein
MRGVGAITSAGVILLGGDAPPSRDDLDWQVDDATLDNTGVLPGVSRTTYIAGDESSLPEGEYENLDFLNNTVTLVNGREYLFENVLFGQTWARTRMINALNYSGPSAVFRDISINPDWSGFTHNSTWSVNSHLSPVGIRGHHFEMYRPQIRQCNDGIGVGGVTGASGVIIEMPYIDKFTFMRPDQNNRSEGTHNDGIAIDAGTGTIVRAATILGFNDPTIGDAAFSQFTGPDGRLHGLDSGNDPEQWMNGACIFVINQDSSVADTQILRGRLTGGQVQVNISGTFGTVTGTTLKDVVFGNDGTVDKGRYNKNVWFNSASYTARTDVSGNTQMSGVAVTTANGRIQLT